MRFCACGHLAFQMYTFVMTGFTPALSWIIGRQEISRQLQRMLKRVRHHPFEMKSTSNSISALICEKETQTEKNMEHFFCWLNTDFWDHDKFTTFSHLLMRINPICRLNSNTYFKVFTFVFCLLLIYKLN